MTTAREVVHNRALSGEELKDILRANFEKLLANEGMLSHYIAFGRVSYDMTLRLHVDNPYMPEIQTGTKSKLAAWNEVQENPNLAVLETPPLIGPSAEASVGATNLHHDITSPNEERLRHGMPIPIIREQQDGTRTQEMVKYPPQDDIGEAKIEITDVTRQTKQEWGIPQDPVALSPTTPVPDAQSIMCKCGRSRGQHALSGIGTPMEGFPVCNEFIPATAPDKPKEAWPVSPT